MPREEKAKPAAAAGDAGARQGEATGLARGSGAERPPVIAGGVEATPTRPPATVWWMGALSFVSTPPRHQNPKTLLFLLFFSGAGITIRLATRCSNTPPPILPPTPIATMPPKNPRDKGKKPMEEPKDSDEFFLDLGDLPKSYSRLMRAIPTRLEQIITSEASSTSKGKKLFEKVCDKLYTAKAGTFLVHLIPDKETPNSESVALLYRWMDLYFEGFYSKGVWFRFEDFEEELPPRSQLPYAVKGGKGVVVLPIKTSYASIGGSSISMGSGAFNRCLKAMLRAPDQDRHRRFRALSSKGILSVPMDKEVPTEFSEFFTKWGTLSEALFKKKVPEEVGTMTLDEIAAILGIIRWKEGMSSPDGSSRSSKDSKGKGKGK
ncbi:hypothetical protein E2562_039159 [Oryza meyeriana var. granulata]|uniref:Uncharacterized protein n=1 Tax=Oryza meyeriana var. granulata TaxID=110450 RepID=A0A6G1CNC0_9ORYZ|nr:hypothetical protein E2562_039159 [Oryza meyeriana var. granulata]